MDEDDVTMTTGEDHSSPPPESVHEAVAIDDEGEAAPQPSQAEAGHAPHAHLVPAGEQRGEGLELVSDIYEFNILVALDLVRIY